MYSLSSVQKAGRWQPCAVRENPDALHTRAPPLPAIYDPDMDSADSEGQA
jgi:hypothetical protein